MWHAWGREEVFRGFWLGGSLGRPRRRWDLRETGIDEAKWTQLAQNRVQRRAFLDTVMNLRVP
jgi:hypothetical protein